MLRILSLVIALLLIISGVILILGYNASPQYSNTIAFEVPYTVDLTWQELLKIKEAPNRKSDVASVEVLEEFGKLVAWQENLKNGGYRIYRMNKRDENRLLVLELTESSYGLKGIWTFDLGQEGDVTIVTLSEESELSDIKRRGYRVLAGRDVDLLAWQKYLKVGLIQALLITP